MKTFLAVALAAGVATSVAAGRYEPGAAPSAAPILTVYKSPTCGCCKAWVDKMKTAGFEVRVNDIDDSALQDLKAKRGVGENLASCHTALVNGYVVEGHVPAEDIHRMLKEKPAIVAPGEPGDGGAGGREGPVPGAGLHARRSYFRLCQALSGSRPARLGGPGRPGYPACRAGGLRERGEWWRVAGDGAGA